MSENETKESGLFEPVDQAVINKLPQGYDNIVSFVLKRKTLCSTFLALLNNQVAYPSELSTMTGIDKRAMYDHLSLLQALDLIKKLKVTKSDCPGILDKHKQRYYEQGIHGSGMFTRRSWYTINTPDQGGPWTLDQLVALRQAILAKGSG